MTWLFETGHAVDLVLMFMLAEGVWLVRRGRASADVVAALAPGALMLLGLRAALTGETWHWVALPLAASLPAHLADLRRRRWL